jgi:DNA polymerase III epsilon subunit-like protein
MKNFAAIDFETANQQRTSVCSVGIVIVRDGEIVDSYYSLIKPEPEYFQVDSKILLKNENNKVFLAFLIFG